MTTVTLESPAPLERIPFRDSRWRLVYLILGFALLIAWRSVSLLDPSWFPVLIPGLMTLLFVVAPQLILLVYPLATREPAGLARLPWPGLGRWIWEGLIATWVIVVTLTLVTVVDRLIKSLWPDATLSPQGYADLANAPSFAALCGILVFSFTVVPVAEEVFFRGFLHNALRARMPWIVAVVVQSAVFGGMHADSVLYSVAAGCMGLVLTLVYEWRRTLLTPILAHAGINAIAALGLLITVNQNANAPILGVAGDPQQPGCVISTILPGSPADRAGLQVGDVIRSVNHVPVTDYATLPPLIRTHQPGEQITLQIERDGEALEIVVTLVRRKDLQPP